MQKPSLSKQNSKALLEPINLDLTPIMNMMLILIPLLVTMAVFTQISVIQFSLPSEEGESLPGEEITPRPPGDVDITLVVTESGFQIIGEGKKMDPIPKNRGAFDFPILKRYLEKLRQEYPLTETIVLLVDPAVGYEDLIGTMDICRESRYTNVALSGGIEP